MASLAQRRCDLLVQSIMYERKLKNNQFEKDKRKRKLGTLHMKSKEHVGNADYQQKRYEKFHRFNKKIDKKEFAILGGLNIILLMSGVFLGYLPHLIVAICLLPVCVARIVTHIMEKKAEEQLGKEQNAIDGLQLQINQITRELEKIKQEKISITEKKNVVDEGLKEIDEYIASLPDFQETNEVSQNITDRSLAYEPTPTPSLIIK